MLRDHYELDKVFVEISQKVSEMDPILAQLDQLLDDDGLFQLIKHDMSKRYSKTTKTGRASTPVEVVLRMLAVKHLYNLSYEETECQVRDSLVLRQFCRVYFNKVPDDTTLIRWAKQLKPETLKAFNERLVQLALSCKVSRGRKLRSDGTVVETNIAYPTDSKLLVDGVRVLSRSLKRIKNAVAEPWSNAGELFRDRSRSAKVQARSILQAAKGRGEAAKATMQEAYGRLVTIAEASVSQAKAVLGQLKGSCNQESQRLSQTLESFVPRLEQVIKQTVQRVFAGKAVAASEKLVSLFEPHTDIICRNKAGKESEFGHKVWLDEVDGGIVTRWSVLEGNPPDESQWRPAIDHHLEQFGKPPYQASGDRGLYSPDNEDYANKRGIKRVILPKPGHKSEARRRHEAQGWFKRGRRFHAGIEGRISVLKRKHGLDRCRYGGEDGFARWVGWGVIAGNLAVMARYLAAKAA
jgi:transposase, IS5 family